MISIVVTAEKKVLVGDMTRVSTVHTALTPNELGFSKVEFSTDGGLTYPFKTYDASDLSTYRDMHIDLIFNIAGVQALAVKVTTILGSIEIKSFSMEVLASEIFFSVDSELLAYEDEILDKLPAGRSTYNYKHRAVKEEILDELNNRAVNKRSPSYWISNPFGTLVDNTPRILESAILDVKEVRLWSCFLTLSKIYDGLSNAVGDVFKVKSEQYDKRAREQANKSLIRLDLNGDGVAENVNLFSGSLSRG